MTVVTSDLHDIAGDEHLRPGGALVLGLCRVIPQEHPSLHCRSVDVSLEADGPAAIAGWVLAEASAATPAAAVALRGGERWLHGYEPRRLERREPPLRKGGVYLITGGLGGIGLTIAEHLARELGARLVLTTRTAPSDRGAPDPRLAGVRLLEELGAEVLVLGADASAPEDMTRVVDATLDRFGTLHGVVHAAGVPGDGLIQLRSADAARAVLAPKVQGTLVLEAVTARVALDFVLLCSSLGSILGGVGQADYASANAFLGAFARSRAVGRDGPRITALAWDVWQEVGMAVNTAVPRELEQVRRHNLRLGITCAEGVECFRRALASGAPELVVSTMDLRARLAAAAAAVPAAPAAPAAAAAPAPAAARYPRPDLTTPYVAPRGDTESAIAEVWAELLGVERVGVDDDFFELGGHSLLALQVISRLRETFLYEVSIEALMDEPSVARLARAVDASDSAERLGEMLALVEQLSEEELQALEQD
jgi:NAD(P)-dependent dehydrogenase (short-subunit alcohol dehydrogenase family)/acyl carrier protein